VLHCVYLAARAGAGQSCGLGPARHFFQSNQGEVCEMSLGRRGVLKAAGGIIVSSLASHAAARGSRPSRIYRDVCVLGGGSAGTHAALRLRDEGASAIVVERSERLGGHAQTYVDPVSGVPINIGVVVFENVPHVQEYLGRFGVVTTPANFGGGETFYIDFSSGRLVEGYAPPGPAESGAALFAYRQILAQFPYLDDGFELPDPVPADLAMPFGQFVEKYALAALFPTVFQFGQGLGDILEKPAIYVLKNFSAAVVDQIFGSGFLIVPGGVAGIYDAAAQELGDDALYEAKVTSVTRGCRGAFPIEVCVSTPTGPIVISSKKLVVAFPPTPEGFAPFDLSRSEESLFKKFKPNHYSTGVVRLSGLPPFASLQNTGNGTAYSLPSLPGIYGLNPTGAPGLWNVKYGSSRLLSERQVKRAIVEDIERIARRNTLPIQFEGFEIFRNHSPFELMASSSDVARGFHQQINSLQGYENTFYSSATFQTHDSSLIWRFNERLLPRILA
jgi:Flavin containing amine oxidoreductase